MSYLVRSLSSGSFAFYLRGFSHSRGDEGDCGDGFERMGVITETFLAKLVRVFKNNYISRSAELHILG